MPPLQPAVKRNLMIQAVSTLTHQTEYLRRLSNKPYFSATLGTHLHLFGQHPASGWAFYLLPGSAVLELRGGSAVLCGELPAGEEGDDAREELRGFLQFLHADTLRTEHPLLLDGWWLAAPLTLWELPKGQTLPLPPAPPAELVLDKAPSMLPVSRLVFAGSDAEADEFYSTACTALAHGVGACRALLYDGRPVCTVGCYEQSDAESYMAAGVTDPAWQGRGLARYLIIELANELASERAVRFACFPELCGFYAQLGFLQIGKIQHYTTDWNIQ